MNIKHSQTYCQLQNTYDIIHGLNVTVHIENNPYEIPVETMFTMALRKNPKRRFLFVSKVLGKHIPTHPYMPLLGGALLALHYLKSQYGITMEQERTLIDAFINKSNMENTFESILKNPFPLPEKVSFIGFAETATALGHSMFTCFQHKAAYIHTTREQIPDFTSVIRFEEEHSHATSHRVYSDKSFFMSDSPVVLVDDEITTGKTALNIIEAIHHMSPRQRYCIACLLDWRSPSDIQRFHAMENKLGIEIRVVSLMSGTIDVVEQPVEIENAMEFYQSASTTINNVSASQIHTIDISRYFKDLLPYRSVDSTGDSNTSCYLKYTGRFGLKSEDVLSTHSSLRSASAYLKEIRTGNKTLCLGTGEFMYIPMCLAAYMGGDVSYHSTTRSPVFPMDKPGYGVQNLFQFECPDDKNIINFIYNIPYHRYDDLFLFLERKIREDKLESLLRALKQTGIPHINLVHCSK